MYLCASVHSKVLLRGSQRLLDSPNCFLRVPELKRELGREIEREIERELKRKLKR